jgi:hypothetical protein
LAVISSDGTELSGFGRALSYDIKQSSCCSVNVLNLKAGFFSQVIDYYSKHGLVANLHAEKPPKEVTVEVQKALS